MACVTLSILVSCKEARTPRNVEKHRRDAVKKGMHPVLIERVDVRRVCSAS
jgi:hypothetical protein